MKQRLAFFVSILLGCSSNTTTGASDTGVAAPLVREPGPALEVLRTFPAFAEHLGKGGSLVRRGEGFAVERVAPSPAGAFVPAGPKTLDVTFPASAHGYTHLASGGVAVDIRAEVEDTPFAAVEGAVVARPSPALDVVVVAERGRVEEIRVLHTFAREHVARWTLRTSAPLRLVDGTVEVLGEDGRSKLATQPMFAVDVRGVRREPILALDHDGPTWTLTARLDTTGMSAPIALDPAWSTTENMGTARRLHTATLLADGRVLVVGGIGGTSSGGPGAASKTLATTEIFDPAGGGSWTSAGTMSEGRIYHSATRLIDGRVLVVGGTGNGPGGGSSSSEIYEPKTNTWSKGPTLPGPRVLHGAAALTDGTVLIAGGLAKAASGTTTTTSSSDFLLPTVLFEGDSKPFRTLTPPPSAPIFNVNPVVVAGTDKRTFFIGGLKPSCEATTCTVASTTEVIVYEESGNSWRTFAKMRRPRVSTVWQRLIAAALFGDGKQMMIVGGGDDSGELLDLTLAKSALGGELSDLWTGARMERLPSGDVISIGGFVPTAPGGDIVLKFFPAPLVRHAKTLRWVNASSPARRRWDHTTTVLSDGRVLIVGGQNKDEALAIAEIFKPLELGEKCADSGDCASAFCVDGVCCDTTCSGQCEACSASGKCLPVVGSPRGLRPLCDSTGSDVCNAKVCDGKTVDQCVLPNGTKCADAVCNVSSFTAEGGCDGKGACIKPAGKECAPFGCSEDGCRTTCAGPTDCANGSICASGKCIAASGGACNAELSASIGTDGKETACHPFRCVQATGKCADSCVRSDDCAGGFVCGGTSKCEQPVVAADEGGGCVAGRNRAGSLASIALALAAIGALRRRRR